MVLAALNIVSIYVLSTMRALVAGEVDWTMAQKNAILSLDRYAEEGKDQDYAAYLRAHTVVQSFREARLALAAPEPDFELAHQGFVAAGVHPGDVVSGMIVLRLFWNTELVREPVRQWEIGENTSMNSVHWRKK